MSVLTVVVRLAADHAADGRMVGQVEIVRTGERVTVRDTDELIEVLRRAASPGVASDAGALGLGPP
jgi:hypothetical protein